ncbi:MAG: hypothetical protein AABX39_03300 [Nanoarchaeota archaeon]
MTDRKHLDVLNKKRIEMSQIVRPQIDVLGYRASLNIGSLRSPVSGSKLEEYCISVKIVPKNKSRYPIPQDIQTKIEEILKNEAKETPLNIVYSEVSRIIFDGYRVRKVT